MSRIPFFDRRLLFTLLLVAGGLLAGTAPGQEKRPPTEAPPNHALLSNALNGWYFVPKEFKEQYDAARTRLEALQGDVDNGRLPVDKAREELLALKQKLEDLRKEIDAKRVLVAGATLHEQTETIEFDLGPEKRLAITANHVRVVGWDGPNVKVELKKMVLAPDDKPVDDHLQAIAIVQNHGRAEFFGMTQAEWEAHDREWLAKYGAKLTESQRAARRKVFQDSFAVRGDYVGKDVDQLSVDGLDYESNKLIEMSVMSEGGNGQYGSARQRYAELTVHVPSCAGVCVRGARRGLVVEKLNASLTILEEGSTDSDARGRFEVRDLKGDLVCSEFPLQTIAGVTGRVVMTAMQEFGVDSAGMTHFDNMRDLTPARPFAVRVHQVGGGVDLRFGRVRLDLDEIHGALNVLNEFGDTRLVATHGFPTAAHRIVSQSGRIEVELSPEAWSSVPILALTNFGGIRTNVDREEFDDFRLGGAAGHDGDRRTWPGFRTVVKDEDQLAVFRVLERVSKIIENTQRSPGLDLFSRSGGMVVLRR